MVNNLKIFIDGACQPNPGSGGIGIYVISNDTEEKISLPLKGTVTNNIAEYEALIFALNTIIKRKELYDHIDIFSDSQLVCMQFNKKWKCKDKNLSVLLDKALKLRDEIKSKVSLAYIPREENKVADELAKDGIS
ncbi:ribonuclease HI family protein [bacterium]|nr:ribonuclease HI family protein [bacterium]|tara:strand:+ start:14370 stop:14774 length:405 start_codon:yes stop_codon:yes gene_type:complete